MSRRAELGRNLRGALEVGTVREDDALLPQTMSQKYNGQDERRRLCVTVQPDGRAVFFLRVPGERPSATWELEADDWLRLAARIARAVAKPDRFGGAVLFVGVERPVRELLATQPRAEMMVEAFERLMANHVEREP
jgi:hypothetical protein